MDSWQEMGKKGMEKSRMKQGNYAPKKKREYSAPQGPDTDLSPGKESLLFTATELQPNGKKGGWVNR